MKQISRPVRKKDAFSLLTGKPMFTADLFPKDALVVKLLRSPYAFAEIESIDSSIALKVPGVACVLTWQDVPQVRYTNAGQSVPQWSPYDRVVLDRVVRFVGDPVAILAAETEEAAQKALKLIKVRYQVKEPVLDFRKALDNPTLVHPEKDWRTVADFGGDARRNLCAHVEDRLGNAEEKMKECAYVEEGVYHTHQASQCFMEPFTTGAYMDGSGRLTLLSSTQIPFHVRRIVSEALELPITRVRVIKPRVGGGFGAKQTAVTEVYAAAAALKTGRPCLLTYTRQEVFSCGSPRHEMELKVRVGADQEGHIRAIQMQVLSNTGAYGEHGPTTIGLSGRQPTSFYRYARDIHFEGTVVYTNTVPAGAYRGFGLTQGTFAVESTVNGLAHKMGIDPVEFRCMNLVHEGDPLGIYNGGEIIHSCRVEDCLRRAEELFDWEHCSTRRVLKNGKIRASGIAVSMQGSGIAYVDTASAAIRLTEDGTYLLEIGATDMGTGCDTILAQIAAERMNCPVEQVHTVGVDTDHSPYDTGSYASSTTYVTGGAVIKACDALKEKIFQIAQEIAGIQAKAELEDNCVLLNQQRIPLRDICLHGLCGGNCVLQGSGSNTQPISPPPFIAGMAEVELDPGTGQVRVTKLTNVIDCGTVINTALARVQAEGGAMQALGMALTEQVSIGKRGQLQQHSLMNYGMPTRNEMPQIQIDFCPSYEETGPFGAKSVGEVVINVTAPAITEAVYQACGLRIQELPLRPEDLALHCAGFQNKEQQQRPEEG